MSRRSRAVASHFHRFKTFLDFFSVQFGINMKVLLSPEIAPNRYILKTLIQHHHLYQISTKLTSSPSVLAVSAQRNFFTSFFCNVLSFSVPIVVDTFSDFVLLHALLSVTVVRSTDVCAGHRPGGARVEHACILERSLPYDYMHLPRRHVQHDSVRLRRRVT